MNKVFLLLLSVFIFSCNKNKLGGNSTIKGAVAHHEKAIANAIVFIKFNAKEFPGFDTSLYDARVKADASGNYFIKCYKGDYYLYGFGFDYGIDPPYTVKGGLPVHIRNNETLELTLGIKE